MTGLYFDENRYAKVLEELDGLEPTSLNHVQWWAIGYYVGALAQNRSVVFNGLPRTMDLDQCKYLMAPLSVSGSVSVCHIAGLTPDAPTLESALRGRSPEEVIRVGRPEIEATLDRYAGQDKEVDLAIFGCPH